MALNTDQPILSRNIEILKKFLGREMPSDIAKEFNFYSKASVSQCSKAAIEALNRHTDCDFPVTASYEEITPGVTTKLPDHTAQGGTILI